MVFLCPFLSLVDSQASNVRPLLDQEKKSPQIRGIIPISQIRKFLICASLQSANLKFFMINPQIANSQFSKNNAQASKQP
jgi:hypothetical protein